MKNSMKYAIAASLIVIAAYAEKITIYNNSGKSLYLALVKTQNYQGDKKLYQDPSGESYRIVSDYGSEPKEITPNTAIKIDNFATPPTKLGVTKYNRSVWVSDDKSGDLLKALNQGQISSREGYAFRLGGLEKSTTKAGVLITKGKDIKFETSDSAIRAAKSKKPEVVEV